MSDTTLDYNIKVIRQYLEGRWGLYAIDAWTFQYRHITSIGIPLDCLAWINPQMNAFLFRAIMQTPVKIDLRAKMAEFLTRVNYPLPIGNWSLDMDSGEIRFKTGLYFGEIQLHPTLIKFAIESVLFFVDKDIYGIISLMYDPNMSITQALNAQPEPSSQDQSIEQIEFEEFIHNYLRSLFLAVDLPEVTNKEIKAFQEYLKQQFGNEFGWGAYDGIPQNERNETALRSRYKAGNLAITANSQAIEIVSAFKVEILRHRTIPE